MITIKGISYIVWDYVTVVTPVTPKSAVANTDSVGGKLLVYLFDAAGKPTQGIFHFVTYKIP